MSVVAKFSVQSVENFVGGNSKVKLNAISGENDDKVTSAEDRSFWQATPMGTLEMTVNNPDAAEQFQPGDQFYLTFDRVNQD